MPATVALHDTVAVPELVRLAGVIAPQNSPDGTESVSVTVPVNPLIAVIVIVEVAVVPTVTAAGMVAAIAKLVIVKVAVVEWDREPIVPVTVRLYVPATEELQITVALPDVLRLVGEIDPQLS